MSISVIRRLRNEMKALEENTDKYIPPELYYIVKIRIQCSDRDSIEKWAKIFLSSNLDHQPLATYTFVDQTSEIILIFSRLEEENDHWHQGSHSLIISHYVSTLSKEFDGDVSAKLVEFASKTQVLAYFSLLVHDNSRRNMILSSRNNISSIEIRNCTHQELLDKLEEYGVDWELTDPSQKYGTFYKLRKKKGKVMLSTISEAFDARDTKKYSMFIFGS